MAEAAESPSRSEDELRKRRLALFDQFEDVASPAELFDLQLALVEEIRLAEAAVALDRESPEYDHRQLIRGLGDAIAWRSLHPYAIRQLHHRAGAPPNLSNQTGFQQTLDSAKLVTERGVPAVICDLTHCLGTGDVVAVTDPDRPILIECGNPRYSQTPRKRRQSLRADAALQQLNTGEAHWPGRKLPTLTVEISSPADHVYDAVQRAIQGAQTNDSAVEMPNPDQAVFAFRADAPFDTRAFDALGVEPGEAAFAVTELHERLPNPRIAPPHVWPIDADCRRAVIESDVVVGHVIRLAAFDGPANGDARLLGADPRRDGIYVKAENAEEAFVTLPGLLEDLLGNYESVQSSIKAMLETLKNASEKQQSRLRQGRSSTQDGNESLDRDAKPDLSWTNEIPGVPSDLVEDLGHRAARRRQDR